MEKDRELAALKRRLREATKELQRVMQAVDRFQSRNHMKVTEHDLLWEMLGSQVDQAVKAFDA